ncbi:MAG TPA: alpha/beta fold hydrolase [Candidatus Dormibacteraeota bacterium]|nr:alpha/beta fold hydrolase [Candidatus Dormibacteraeota bacterium]HVD03896.1 alpha/beta fold hydrolase [Candidatus Dormibacteraeota bacterium]
MSRVVRHGGSLHDSEVGSGHPLLFHKGGGGDGRMWERAGYLPQLPGLRHLLLDHRGHAQSDWPSGVEAHRVNEYVAACLAVLDDAGVEKAAMVGYSDGSRVIFELAARHRERVAAMVNIGGVAAPADTQRGSPSSFPDIYDREMELLPLYHGPESGDEHYLARYPRGLSAKGHRHSAAHPMIVLEGRMGANLQVVGPFAYCHFPAAHPMRHAPAEGEGCRFVLIFHGPFDVEAVDPPPPLAWSTR